MSNQQGGVVKYYSMSAKETDRHSPNKARAPRYLMLFLKDFIADIFHHLLCNNKIINSFKIRVGEYSLLVLRAFRQGSGPPRRIWFSKMKNSPLFRGQRFNIPIQRTPLVHGLFNDNSFH